MIAVKLNDKTYPEHDNYKPFDVCCLRAHSFAVVTALVFNGA